MGGLARGGGSGRSSGRSSNRSSGRSVGSEVVIDSLAVQHSADCDPNIPWSKIRVEYEAGKVADDVICEKYHLDLASFRRSVREFGWKRNFQSLKRELVESKTRQLEVIARPSFDDGFGQFDLETDSDAIDMANGVDNARNALLKIGHMLTRASSANEVRSLVQANHSAVETIRKIRGLDQADAFEDMTAEQLTVLVESYIAIQHEGSG